MVKTIKSEKAVEVKSSIIPDVQGSPVEVEAVVYNGIFKVRSYNLQDHGKDFETLANNFASKKKFTVKLEEVKQGIKCPSCGHIIEV